MRPRRKRSAAELLGLAAITPDGLAITEEGSYIRYLETGAVNPLTMEPTEAERISGAFAQIAARLTDRQSLQLSMHAKPLDLQELLAGERHACEQAAGAAEDAGQSTRATAIRGLASAQEQTMR